MAFVLRFVFAYGISAGDNYALSGGSNATNHLRIVTEILSGTYNPSNEISLNYPFGAGNVTGPLFDYVIAAFAFVVSATGVSDATAAAGTLAWSAPIFGALTCIPVFLIGKRMFKDELVGIVAALFYAVMAVLVMTTVFSNGTEFPFLCFIVAWMVYFVASALAAVDAANAIGIKSVISDRNIRTYTLLAAVFMAFVNLTWNDFWAVVMTSSIIVFFTLLFERIGGRDLGVTVGIANIILLVGVLVGAIYYIPSGLWSTVFSGGCLVAVLTAVYSFIFLALEKKPWVLSVPLMLVIIVAVAVVFAVALPELSHAMLNGSNGFQGSLMTALTEQFSRTSISAMAAYYGWLTVWFPLFVGVWMAYKYRANAKSKLYAFTMLWMLACFFVGWFNTDYAIVAGAGFAVGIAALIVKVLKAVDLKAYFASLRGNGVKAGAKKALNFFPFVTVIVAVFLVAVPTAVYAVDASTPTNDEHASYFGGLGYTINTSDSTLVGSAWNHSSEYVSKDATLLSWYGYSDSASSVGKFSTVTSSVAGGTSAMASAYLSSGSAGAIATLAIRLVENDANAQSAIFTSFGVADVVKYIDNASEARKYIAEHPETFISYSADIKDQSLPYVVGVQYLTSNLSESKIVELYNALCIATGHSINYIEADSSMVPLYYGDNTYASTIGYFGDYAIDNYGAPSKFYTVDSTTQYYYQYGYYDQMYYTYNSAMYDTFMWNAVLGVTPEQFGLSGSLALLSALANSDGSVKATPAACLDNFDVAYWHVMYRADEKSSWTDMDATEAIAKQNNEGGFINYLASVVVLEYNASANQLSGKVTTDGSSAVAGVKVAVFEKLNEGDVGYDAKGVVSYVQRSTAVTAADGTFTVSVPVTGDYVVKYIVGSTTLRDGTVVETKNKADFESVRDYTLAKAPYSGKVVDGKNAVFLGDCTLSFIATNGEVISVTPSSGLFTTPDMVPGIYTVNVYDPAENLLNTQKVSIVPGITDLMITAATCSLDITVNDMYGQPVTEDVIVTIMNSLGETWTVTALASENGKVTTYVSAGSYSVYAVGSAASKFVSTEAKAITANKDGSSSASLTVYPAVALSVPSAGTVVSALGYTAVSTGTEIYVPKAIQGVLATSGAATVEVSGKLMKNDKDAVAGTIAFITASGTYIFSTDGDGNFTGKVPSSDACTVYATDNSGLAFIGTLTPAKDLVVTMAAAYSVTESVYYSSPSQISLAYVPLKFEVSGTTIPAVTGTDGKCKIFVPSGSNVKCTAPATSFAAYTDFKVTTDFVAEKENVTSNSTLSSFSISSTGDDKVANTIAKGSLTFTGFTGKILLDAYSGDTYDRYVYVSAGTITKICKVGTAGADGDEVDFLNSGRYTVTLKDSTTSYIDSQSINLFPNTKAVKLDVLASYKVTVTKSNDSDKIAVVALDGGEYKVSGNVYYLENGKHFYLTATNADGNQMAFSQEYSSEGTFTYTLADKVTLKGYVGSKLNGDVTITFGSSVVFAEVKDGEFSADILKGASVSSVKLNGKHSDDNYLYTVTAMELVSTAFTVDEDSTHNSIADTVREANNEVLEITGTMTDGVGNLILNVTNTNDFPVTYTINGSTGFTLDKMYSITLAGGASGPIVVAGHYSELAVGAGSKIATISLIGSDGKAVVTKVIPAALYTGGASGDVTVAYADNEKVNDAVDGYSYKYAVAVKNTYAVAKSVSLVATTADAGWTVSIVDDSGYQINASSYEVAGLGTTTLYVMLVNDKADSSATVPAIHLTVSGDVSDSKDLSAQSASVSETSGSVSGGHADNNEKGVSTGFWIVTVLTVLVLLLLIWGGMKRGVFSRRN
ncbi:MAG: hypothetical protein MJZ38_02365 [archaeon]|nr:hypothetical protein [archaeon]